MTKLPYDPADGQQFWDAIRHLPGFPAGETRPIKEMIFESGALFKTTSILTAIGARQAGPLVVVMDETEMRRDGVELKGLITGILRQEGWRVQVAVMRADESGQVHTDMPHIHAVQAALSRGCSVLAVGSGVVADIAKHGCFLYQEATGEAVPFAVFQTANSVSAFTSNMAPTLVNGVKRTLDSRYPDALICDLETLRDAPPEMTAGGVGDMLAVFVSFPDWYLAYRLGMDSTYSELAKHLVGPLDELLLTHVDGFSRGDMESVAVLAKVIALGGLAMSLSHATTPMSGFEHVVSHMLDLQAELDHTPMAVHGSQVALATLGGLEMYSAFLATFDPARLDVGACYPSPETMRRRVEEAFRAIDPSGKAGAECWADYQQKLEKWHAHRADFEAVLRDWPAVRAQLAAESRPPEVVLQILRAVQAPVHWSELTPPFGEARTRFAYINAPLMRKRLTLGDLLLFTGWDREALWQHVWARYA
jgi:glycerol-1-phosphate dehydrogenase [NAD(P)+]